MTKENHLTILWLFMWAHEKEIVQNLQQPPEGTLCTGKTSHKQSYVQGLSEMPKAKSGENINTLTSDYHDQVLK